MSACGFMDPTRLGQVSVADKAISEIGYAIEILQMLRKTLKEPVLDAEDKKDINIMFIDAVDAVYQAEGLVVKENQP